MTYFSGSEIFPHKTKFGSVRIWSMDTLLPNLVNFSLLFHGAKWLTARTFFVAEQRNLAALWSGQSKLIPPNFVNFGPGSVIPCRDMHQSFTDARVKWFLDNFPMFADSFTPSVVSIHCVARRLGKSFLYKRPASRGSSLRQHGLLVKDKHRSKRRFTACLSCLLHCLSA